MSNLQKNKKSLYETSKPAKYRERISESLSLLVDKFLNSNPAFEEFNCPFCHSHESFKYFTLQNMIYLRLYQLQFHIQLSQTYIRVAK